MTQSKSFDVVIVGGGLAGLSCALHLSKQNYHIALIEKYKYPHHKVCGEYVSNEVLSYLKFLGIDPFSIGAKRISKFELTNKNGASIRTGLPMGGFGISRYAFDNLMYKKLADAAEVIFDTVTSIQFQKDHFQIQTANNQHLEATFVVGAFGKRSNIDINLKRGFIRQRSPWLGVKAHYQAKFPEDTVALHNFEGGYCGLSKTEANTVNACYLTTFNSFQRIGTIPEFQEQVLSKNPHLKHFFAHAKPVFEKPLTISQISFQRKEPVKDHIFMIGDSAGLIHPLCGNGMAMAIHAAKLFSELFIEAKQSGNINRIDLEQKYALLWKKTFSKRLRVGRGIQQMLLHPLATNIGFMVARTIPALVPALIKNTHGKAL